MAVRSRRFLGAQAIPVAVTALYTVPAGRTLVVRTLRVVNTHTVNTYTFSLWWPTSAVGSTQFQTVALGPGLTWTNTDWCVLNPGDVLYGQSSNTGVKISGYGALLLGEPV